MDVVLDGLLGLSGARHGNETVSGKHPRVKGAQQEELRKGGGERVSGTKRCRTNQKCLNEHPCALLICVGPGARRFSSHCFCCVSDLVPSATVQSVARTGKLPASLM